MFVCSISLAFLNLKFALNTLNICFSKISSSQLRFFNDRCIHKEGEWKKFENFFDKNAIKHKKRGSPIFFHNPNNSLKRIFQKNSNLLPSNGFTLYLCLVSVILDFFQRCKIIIEQRAYCQDGFGMRIIQKV